MSAGQFSLRFPMVVAPRYNPKPIIQMVNFQRQNSDNSSGWGVIDQVPDRDKISPPVLDPKQNAKINPVSINIHLAAGFPLGEVTSAYHKINQLDVDETTKKLALANESVPADRDFELIWKPEGTAPNAALFRQNVEGQDYLMAFITPPTANLAKLPKRDREVIFCHRQFQVPWLANQLSRPSWP